jgi:hypothetical protein
MMTIIVWQLFAHLQDREISTMTAPKSGVFTTPSPIDDFVKTSKLLATVIPALDNNTQGQASAGIQ